MKHKFSWILLLVLAGVILVRWTPAALRGTTVRDTYVVMCYNVENLFDTEDDPHTSDNEFLPDGTYRWTRTRYEEKLQHLYQVIAGLGGWSAPDVVGLVEVENRAVLDDLMHETPLARAGYDAVHYDSPDTRGIDVALLYRRESMRVLASAPIPVRFPDQPHKTTRDILYVKGVLASDTLHFFVNHWPSRSGGEKESAPYRRRAAQTLRRAADSLLRIDSKAKILMMGDFNDTPDDVSLTDVLHAVRKVEEAGPGMLFNLTSVLAQTEEGSYKYRGQWNFLDQMIVSEGLLNASSGLSARPGSMHLYVSEQLLESDKTYLGYKPFRMYTGPQYHGGYSDHLPVYVQLTPAGVK